jgi:hypothetical protein
MAKNNFPQAGIDNLEPEFVAEVVQSLRELNELGKPDTDDEVKDRIDKYFEFCQRTGNRPGIESLCMALHISRTTLFNWNAGINCSPYRQEIIITAKGFIAAFLEQAITRGKISPPSGIFLMKNWLNYKDTISFENSVALQPKDVYRTAEQIAADYIIDNTVSSDDVQPDF